MADKARNAAAIEREIERTRDELARSVDLLADRLSPKNAARRGMVRATEEAGRVAADVSAMVRWEPREDKERSPLTGPLLIGAGALVAAGALWYLSRRRRRR